LMIASALAGLLALVMPCVWPMVPITVNFFVKQGQSKKAHGGSTTGLAVTYCLAIIGVFTTVGVLASFFVSATALSKLANNPWLNFGVAGLFFAFGLSLLGLFEISLPTALLNASARGESRGGLLGVVFMALTLTITSFTCTFPVVGGLLVMAAGGQFFYPIIGLATFSTVLALPFFLLALAPGLLSKMPKSGDWMNSVKVVGGLVEIGAAFKFLNTAELAFVTPENAWFDAQFVLTTWVVLAAVCGFYLLGFFRTNHDHGEVQIGPGRMIVGTSFLGMALFLAPALFGRPPQSLIWDRLVAGLLPPDAYQLSSGPAGATGPAAAASETPKLASSTDPDKAQREEKRFHGVWWGFSYDEAIEKAKAEGKPVLIDFTGVNCANCRLMEARVLPRPEIVALLKEFVPVQLYTDFVPINSIDRATREKLAEKNLDRELDLTKETINPFYVIVAPDQTLLAAKGGYREPEVFQAFLKDALAKHRSLGKVTQNR
jgi:thiol:disulfide interchange protein